MARTNKPANVVGPQIRRRRIELGLTQERLAARCQLRGLDLSRGTLSHIEARIRSVRDQELVKLAQVLDTTIGSLFPAGSNKGKSTRAR